MTARTPVHRLQVASNLHRFIEDQVLPGTGVPSAAFWQGFDAIVADLAPKNIALLAERDRLQAALDEWHAAHPGPITAGDSKNPAAGDSTSPSDMKAYRAFLENIGYLVPQPKKVNTTTSNVDAELAKQAGPQLVVPILNARYALNAANARWGSLYDALYGTDVIPDADGAGKVSKEGKGYNPVRGDKVIAYARHVLDRTVPLKAGSHVDSTGYAVKGGKLVITLNGGRTGGSTGGARAGTTGETTTTLADARQFIGYQGDAAAPSSILLQHNGLHIDIQIDRSTAIGKTDAAGVSDLVLEAALSTILDLDVDVQAVVLQQDRRRR